MSDIDLFEDDAPPVKRCDGCGMYFPENELKRCRACGEVFCKDCQKTHDCRNTSKVQEPLNEAHEPKTDRSEKDQKEEKIGKILLACVIIVVVLSFICCGCGFMGSTDNPSANSPNTLSPTTEPPTTLFDKYYDALRYENPEKVWSMLSSEEQEKYSEIGINNIIAAKRYQFIFYDEYEITNEVINGNNAYLDVTITYENLYGIKYTKDFEVKCVYEDGVWKIAKFDAGM